LVNIEKVKDKSKSNTMSKNDIIKAEGQVIDVLPNATFKVKLSDTDLTILSYASGKMRQHEIRILMGDQVDIEMSPYDLSKGRIVRRK